MGPDKVPASAQESDAESLVYRSVRKRIVDGEYPGGTHLSTESLASSLGVSRTPVRGALRRLQAEGLVELHVNRGAFVASWTRTDVDEVFNLRVLLEGHACEHAAMRIGPEAIARMQALCASMDGVAAASAAGRSDKLTALNEEFHRLILQECGQPRLANIVKTLVDLSMVMRTFAAYSREELMRSMDHHRELVAAFRSHDPGWAGSVMRSHLSAAHQVTLRSQFIADDTRAATPRTPTGIAKATGSFKRS
ncbi:GntR family transcriptional regulator [Variovorax sp. PBL-E5]|uniref:GntR family transcriptional regulator n=1 Tax=Variovorax sp. PBL-E5 TaxID=434014 RepID=UPI0013184399|nr:GntR family transcriptional regulator [Variovorax sp. PBL-E5]VTU46037.1 Carbon starvation induced regulator [Variovorax sp. PBL-E5]